MDYNKVQGLAMSDSHPHKNWKGDTIKPYVTQIHLKCKMFPFRKEKPRKTKAAAE